MKVSRIEAFNVAMDAEEFSLFKKLLSIPEHSMRNLEHVHNGRQKFTEADVQLSVRMCHRAQQTAPFTQFRR